MVKTAIILSVIHLLYYAYVGIIYQFVKMGSIYNTPNEKAFNLRSMYGVKVKTFRKEGSHWGFSLGKTIYLNERLFNIKKGSKEPYKALRWVFHHEYYHLKHHRVKVFVLRVVFSLVPLMLIIPINIRILFFITLVVYCSFAYMIDQIVNVRFEKQANDYADKMIKRHD